MATQDAVKWDMSADEIVEAMNERLDTINDILNELQTTRTNLDNIENQLTALTEAMQNSLR